VSRKTALALCALVLSAMASPDERSHAQQPSLCNPADSLATLVVTVIDRATRVPLRAALVSSKAHQVRTDSAGKAVLCVAPGHIDVRAAYFSLKANTRVPGLTLGRPLTHTFTLDVPAIFLRGTVLDQQTGAPVVNVPVRIVNTPLSALTDANGRFYFQEVPIGDYTLRADHIAYAAAVTRLEVRADDLDVEVRLTPEAIAIQPIVVTAFSRRLETAGFYEREKRGVGTFIERKQIEKMKAQTSSDLLRNVPGLRLVPQATRRNVPPNQMRGRGNCRFKYIVDGARTLSDFDIDFIAPYAIEGLEVYAGLSEVPAAFRASAMADGGQTICGVIAIWTRDGP
jgi:hypothetical protein